MLSLLPSFRANCLQRRQKGNQNFSFITIKPAIGECGLGLGFNGFPNPECQN